MITRKRCTRRRPALRRAAVALACIAAFAFTTPARAAERITLTNGFHLTCNHRAAVGSPAGNRIRLYMDSGSDNFIEVRASQIASAEPVKIPDTRPAAPQSANPGPAASTPESKITPAELQQLLARAGQAHDLDVDLLASVVREESGGHPRAVSRAGAQGLMQLMPSTAARLGVTNAFAPGQNIRGGAAYLDALLHRYHDNLALALAAYNAGPAAVAHWHGIPPYRETQLYVARVIHEFNRRIAARRTPPLTQVASALH
ncbi:MAG TPA: lytic transglycosylase domain-containing protein [Acidobacteriaceae bacterium]|nr:lytic transglycosylase domain-containing protein [Acidobacteriaceae bacterium]